MGTYRDNKWFCECDIPAKPYTSGKPDTKGQQFWRCSKGKQSSCSFFLWESEEREARESFLRRTSPRTPSRAVSELGDNTLLTPSTGSSSKSRATRAVSPQVKLESSPTPSRRYAPSSRKEARVTLATEVIDLIDRMEGRIDSRTEELLRELIDKRVSTLESQLSMVRNTLSMLTMNIAD